MKLNILLTTGIISLALLSGCDKGSEQPTNTAGGDIAIPAPAPTPAPEATTAPAETATPAAK